MLYEVITHAITAEDGNKYVKLLSDYLVKYNLSIQADFLLNNSTMEGGQ